MTNLRCDVSGATWTYLLLPGVLIRSRAKSIPNERSRAMCEKGQAETHALQQLPLLLFKSPGLGASKKLKRGTLIDKFEAHCCGLVRCRAATPRRDGAGATSRPTCRRPSAGP